MVLIVSSNVLYQRELIFKSARRVGGSGDLSFQDVFTVATYCGFGTNVIL